MTTSTPDVIERMADHLIHQTTDLASDNLRVPKENFVSTERLQRELAVLRRMPLIVARGSQIPEPGNFITRDVLGTPLIIARRTDGSVAAHVNICRHRGGRIENDESGFRRTFVCNYHGWTYGRDCGELRHVPYEESFGSVDKSDFGLRTVRAEERHGFVWVDFSGDEGRTVSEYLGPEVAEQLEEMGVAKATVFLSKSFTLDINWKLIVDGATDMLHPRFLHPQGVGKLLETNVYVWKPYGRHGHLFAARRRLRELVESGQAPDDFWKYVGGNLYLYPNSLVIAAPDHIEFWTVWPSVERPDQSTVEIRFLVDPGILDERIEKRINQSWDILEQAALQEDFPMEQSIQDNLRASVDGYFLYGRNELPNQHVHRQLERDLDGIDDATNEGRSAQAESH